MKILTLLFVVCAFGFGFTTSGCTSEQKASVEDATPMKLCASCGQIKGSTMCCAEGAAACDSCGLHKGAPGCCKIEKGGEDAALCSDCGHVKGAEGCCDADAARCEKCGMAEGSPLCCVDPASYGQ